MNRLVLFDIDETMIKSDGAGRRAIVRVLQKVFGVAEITTDVNMSGKTDPQIIHEVLAALGFSRKEIDERLPETFAIYPAILEEEIAAAKTFFLLPGVVELIEALAVSEGACLGLLTGNIEAGARLKLAPFSLNHFFPVGAYGSDSADRLDLPGVAAERAARHFNRDFRPADLVIIGDSVNDINCARGYGATCVAVNTGRTSREELERAAPEFLFPTLSETDRVLTAIFSDR